MYRRNERSSDKEDRMIKEKIISHLRAQYKGVLTEDQIIQHIDDYVGDRQAQYLLGKIQPFIANKEKIQILDVGCGYGSFVLLSNKKGYNTVGVELEEFEYEIAQQRAKSEGQPANLFNLGSALNLPFEDETFHIVTFWNVLEHVSDYARALEEAKRVLKKEGKIFIIAPNYFSFRKEAHYQVPWAPFLTKSVAKYYLKLLKRNPWFFENCIFYISMFGVVKKLNKMGFSTTTDISEKIKKGHSFKAQWFNRIIKILNKIGLKTLIPRAINLLRMNPCANSIDLIAIKYD